MYPDNHANITNTKQPITELEKRKSLSKILRHVLTWMLTSVALGAVYAK